MHEENLRQLKELSERISRLEKTLHGNGHDGLFVVVDRVHQNQQFHQKIDYAIFIAVAGTAAQVLWPTLVKLIELTTK